MRHQMCAWSLAFGFVRLLWIFKSCLSHPFGMGNAQLHENISPPLKRKTLGLLFGTAIDFILKRAQLNNNNKIN